MFILLMNVEKYISGNSLKIIVKPNSKKTEIMGYDEQRKALRLSVKAPAEKNKANLEIIKYFSKILKKQVKIKGLSSKEKLLVFD